MKILKSTIDKIEKLRTDYLNSLPQFQELFIELMINDSDCYIFQLENKEIGYAIINDEGILIELYVLDNYIPESRAVFNKLIKDMSITDVYCKSFDSLLLDHCLSNSLSYSLAGVLYRDYTAPRIEKDSQISMKKTDISSIDFLTSRDDSIKELFETEEQLTNFVQNENVFMFYKNNDFVGCGMILRTNSNWNYCDLGVWVEPQKRGNSIGSQIILNLREFAIGENMIPSCGCAIENIASQKTIEKSGFVSKHKLVHFTT